MSTATPLRQTLHNGPVQSAAACLDYAVEDSGAAGMDRRTHERLAADDLDWLKSVRLKFGPSLKLLDLSAGGALVESATPLRPGSTAALTITGRGVTETATFRVLRCEVASVNGGIVYRGACVFERMIALPGHAGAGGRATSQQPRPLEAPSHRDRLIARVQKPDDELEEVLGALRAAAGRQEGVGDSAAMQPAPAEGTGWSRIVVRYMDGRLLKGFSQDFHASRQHFHVSPSINGLVHKPVLVPMSRLKAVFFVRDFEGQPDHVKRQSFDGPLPGRRIEITFLDDEVIVGATLGYRPDGTGFFITPADSSGNNLRVFVVPGAIRHIRYL